MTLIYSLWAPTLTALFIVTCAALLLSRGKAILKQATLCMLFVACIGGFLLYAAAYAPAELSPAAVAETAIHAVFSTSRMFLMEEDYGYLAGNPAKAFLVQSPLYNLLFWACHVMALFVSIAALLSLFGRRFIQQLRLRFGAYDHSYLICGSDDRALTLGRNLATHDGKTAVDRRRLVVYLDKEFSREALETIEALEAVYLEYEDDEQLAKALAKTGLHRRSSRRGCSSLFLLAQEDTGILRQAACLATLADQPLFSQAQVTVYAFAEPDWLLERLENIFAASTWDFRLFQPADLSARLLVGLAPPCQCLTFEAGVTKEDFTLMILGFGQRGKAILRRLVMTGQFLHSNMRIIVVDKDISHLLGQFLHAYPGLANYTIEPWPWDVRSTEFYRRLEKETASLHYIVLSLNSDSLNLDTAQDLRRHFLQYRVAPGRQPVIAAGVRERKCIAAQPPPDPLLWGKSLTTIYYGAYEDLYTEDMVINEASDHLAKAIAQVYYDSDKANPPPTPEAIWRDLSYFHRESNRAAADFFPSMLRLAGLSYRQLAEGESFVLPSDLRLVLGQTEHLRWSAFHFAMGYQAMTLEEMTAFARELQEAGKPIKDCRIDTLRRRHICLVPWAELVEVAGAYNALLGATGGEARDFQQNDLEITDLLPAFVHAAQAQAGQSKKSTP